MSDQRRNQRDLESLLKRLIQQREASSPAVGDRYSEVRELLVNMANRIVGRSEMRHHRLDPEDVVHDWFVILFDGGFPEYDPNCSSQAYVFGTLWRICSNQIRKNRRMRGMPQGYEAADTRFNPMRSSAKREFQEVVRKNIASLPSKLRQAIHAQVVDGLSAEQAAAKEGISTQGIYTRRYRGREHLRGGLEGYWDRG